MATARPSSNRRGKKAEYDPLRHGAKTLADQIWEAAKALADTLAPEQPTDTEPLDDMTQWLILETLAIGTPGTPGMSPEFWDDPDAIDDYHRLLGLFAPDVPRDYLKPIAKAKRASQRALPDVSITPESPEYEAMMRRMKRSG